MEIYLAIKQIYPELTDNDFMVLDDNQWEWPYIKWYNTEIPQPTQSELETAWLEFVKLQEQEQLKKQKAEEIAKIATITDQINLIAWTLDIIVDLLAETNPELLTNPWIVKSKEALNWIKNILNK